MTTRNVRTRKVRGIGLAIGILGLALAALQGSPARAGAALRREVAGLVHELTGKLKERGESSVAIDRLQGPANLPTSSGPGLAQLLAESFQREGIAIDSKAKLRLKGEYRVAEVDSQKNCVPVRLLAVRLKGVVEDAQGNALDGLDFDRKVRDEESFVEMMATPVGFTSTDDELGRDQKLRESLVDSQAVIEGSAVFDPTRTYAIEVLVAGAPREVREQGTLDLPFVTIDRGERYHVRLINKSDFEAAATLLVDGLNIYEFSEVIEEAGPQAGRPKYSVIVIPPRASVVIKGWHRNNQESNEFEVMEVARGAVAQVAEQQRSAEKIGTINALFRAAWPEGQPPPVDEAAGEKGQEGNATGFGPRIDAQFMVISKRTLGRLRSSVSIRYSR